jgi:Bifunctional DNA primase/polymerase, N-terminal
MSGTGNRGFHLLFQSPTDGTRIKSRGAVVDGIDIRAEGGYFVAPPSLHFTGRRSFLVRWKEPGGLATEAAASQLGQLSSETGTPLHFQCS